MRDSRKSVIVIGGGVAGIAAATALADAGLRVAVYEKRPMLGGRASSFYEHETGERIDSSQHGTMRCCTNLANLFDRLGVHEQIRYHDTLHFLDSAGVRSFIASSPLPAPLHMSPSFLGFRSLGIKDKLAIARAMAAMLRPRKGIDYDTLDIGEWYRRTGQTERAVKRFWEPVLVSACNESLDRICCTLAFKLFRDGFLGHRDAFMFGIPSVPLGSLYTEPAITYVHKRGGCVSLRTIVNRVHFEGGAYPRISGLTLQDGDEVHADYYVSALQFDLLLKLLPSELTLGVEYFENLKRMELSPIVGVHLWYDRPIDCPDAVALLDRRSDWIFNKTRNFNIGDKTSTYLSVVISADREIADMPKEEVYALVRKEVEDALPEARAAVVTKWLVVKERKATFSSNPGVEALRPDQQSPIENLFVAGEWTRTGWPSTMESACRSGYLAAERLLAREGTDTKVLVPDLPRRGLARLLMGDR